MPASVTLRLQAASSFIPSSGGASRADPSCSALCERSAAATRRRRPMPRTAVALAAVALSHLSPRTSLADNPIVQTLYTADPAPLVYDGRVYVYTSHDEDTLVNDFFTMNDWRLYSSKDMVNWTDHGSPLGFKSFSWSNGDAWAGQVVQRNGKFYYYVPVNQNGGKVIGVAVADTPLGPFKDPIGKPLVTSDCGTIDPTVFIDDDDQAYLYWGNPSLCYVKLNTDMISYSGKVEHVPMTTASFGVRTKTDRVTSYEEGPWFYKRQGRYYLVFAGGPISEHIAYSTSAGPTGPWTYAGVIMPTEGASFTNHAGVIDFEGKSYFFYHNGALQGGGGFHRSVCVEEFSYGADGKIPQIKMSKTGPSPIATLDPYQTNEAESMAWESGIETERCSEGGMNVTSISSGDYIKVKNVDFGTGATSFAARVAASESGGTIQIRVGSQTGTLIGSCTVPASGGLQSWTNVTCPVTLTKGITDVFFVFGGTGTFSFNHWQFTGSGGASGAAGAGGASGVAPRGGASFVGGTTSTGGASSQVTSATNEAASGGRSTSTALGGASAKGSTALPEQDSTSAQGGTTFLSASTTKRGTGGSGALGSVTRPGGGSSAALSGASENPTNSHAVDTNDATGGPSEQGGCACRVGQSASASSASILVLALGLLVRRSRRRSHRLSQRARDECTAARRSVSPACACDPLSVLESCSRGVKQTDLTRSRHCTPCDDAVQ